MGSITQSTVVQPEASQPSLNNQSVAHVSCKRCRRRHSGSYMSTRCDDGQTWPTQGVEMEGRFSWEEWRVEVETNTSHDLILPSAWFVPFSSSPSPSVLHDPPQRCPRYRSSDHVDCVPACHRIVLPGYTPGQFILCQMQSGPRHSMQCNLCRRLPTSLFFRLFQIHQCLSLGGLCHSRC